MSEIRIQKPKGYRDHFIVNDPHPKLIINLDYTMFQAHRDLGEEGEEFEVTVEEDCLVIKNKDSDFE